MIPGPAMIIDDVFSLFNPEQGEYVIAVGTPTKHLQSGDRLIAMTAAGEIPVFVKQIEEISGETGSVGLSLSGIKPPQLQIGDRLCES